MKNLSLKAIIVGFLVDITVSQALGAGVATFMGLMIGVSLARSGTGPSGVATSAALAQTLTTSPLYLFLALFEGLLATVVGGYTAAFIASHSKLLNAGACGTLSLVLGAVFFAGCPLWFTTLSVLLVVPAALLGGWVCLKLVPPTPSTVAPLEKRPLPPISNLP